MRVAQQQHGGLSSPFGLWSAAIGESMLRMGAGQVSLLAVAGIYTASFFGGMSVDSSLEGASPADCTSSSTTEIVDVQV